MHHGQHGEGITERFVNHVPEVEDLLRAREEEQALGQRGFFSRGVNRLLEFAIAAWGRIRQSVVSDSPKLKRMRRRRATRNMRTTSRIIM